MSELVEKEIQTALTKEQYEQLKHHFQFRENDKIVQENYYFDTLDKQLWQYEMGLRIRLTQSGGELTLKIPIKKHEKLEVTDTFSREQGKQYIKTGTFPHGAVYTKLSDYHLSLDDMVPLGYLKNERFEKVTNDTIWVLDKSHFQTGTTYELECEYSDTRAIFDAFLKEHAIPYKKLPSKLARALAHSINQ